MIEVPIYRGKKSTNVSNAKDSSKDLQSYQNTKHNKINFYNKRKQADHKKKMQQD